MKIQTVMTTTTFAIEGYKTISTLGVVRGITVRSRSVLGNIGAGIQIFFGGRISLYANLCEQAREEAFQSMLQHASEVGANAVVGVRYDATEIMQGVTEVLVYGTAALIEKNK
ncbi:MAG: YbjQ family protein [Pseudobdellovibrio sp.]